ncbi:MAG: transporter substrate-binding domain-containing protein [Coriobacteriales bacterium]|nr:transporter substrate-binding domain-containing protein [Coriobacteriales bacterium]
MSNKNFSLDRRQFLRGASFLAATPFLAALASCGNSASTASSASNTSAASSTGDFEFAGPFIVGFDQDFPPYGYVGDDGSYTGFDLELAQEVCKVMQWEYKPEPIAWDSKDALLNSGQITCIWNGFTIEGRENDYTFTDAYMENRQVIVVSAKSNIAKLADLKGKNVVTQTDSAALGLLSDGGSQAELGKTFAKLDTIGEYNTAFMMLSTGEYDAVAVDYPVAVFNIGDKKDYVILEEPLNSEHFGVGFAKTDEGKVLAELVQATLQGLDSDGFVKTLCEKYASQGVSYDAWVLPKATA